MNLNYYKGKIPNFGDELNPYIFHSLFKGMFNDQLYPDISFYGIGTLIDQKLLKNRKSIIFGTGVRNTQYNYWPNDWDIRFVRGPISSNLLGLRGEKWIADSAYLLPLVSDFKVNHNTTKNTTFKTSIIPYFTTMDIIPWESICKLLDIHLIDPRENIFTIFDEVNNSERVIAGAMHGAIIADILRKPWLRLRMEALGAESFLLSDIKWEDWITSINCQHFHISIANYNSHISNIFMKLTGIAEIVLRLNRGLKIGNFQLSDDTLYLRIIDKLHDEVQKLKKDYQI